MRVSFEKISTYPRKTLLSLLVDAYSGDHRFADTYMEDWIQFDDFFYSNIQIADQCGFITRLNNKPIGFVTWDPRNLPESVRVGHNCIATEYKAHGYGKLQMEEAVNRILTAQPAKIVVSTGNTAFFLPARKMYEAVGFIAESEYKQDHVMAPEMVEYCFKI